jgi:hypothetical protein
MAARLKSHKGVGLQHRHEPLTRARGLVSHLRQVVEVGIDLAIVNRAPVANHDMASTKPATPVTINVLANDFDPDGDPLTVTIVADPPNGTATRNPDNTVTYRPRCGFTGTDSFGYQISDGRGGTASALVTVQVRRTSRRGSC